VSPQVALGYALFGLICLAMSTSRDIAPAEA